MRNRDRLSCESLIDHDANMQRADDIDKPFAKDIKAAVESEEYAAAINAPGSVFSEFQKPEWMKARAAQ